MKEIVFGLVRHGVTALGTALTSHGIVSANVWTQISGSVLVLLSFVLSVIAKKVETKSTDVSQILSVVSDALKATPEAPVAEKKVE